jgi:hypothetical protein
MCCSQHEQLTCIAAGEMDREKEFSLTMSAEETAP